MHHATLVLVFQVLLHALPPSSALRIFPQSTLLRSPLQPFDQPSPGIGSNKNWGRHEALAHPLCQHISTLTNSGVSTINQINQLRCSLASCLCCPCYFGLSTPSPNLSTALHLVHRASLLSLLLSSILESFGVIFSQILLSLWPSSSQPLPQPFSCGQFHEKLKLPFLPLPPKWISHDISMQ